MTAHRTRNNLVTVRSGINTPSDYYSLSCKDCHWHATTRDPAEARALADTHERGGV